MNRLAAALAMLLLAAAAAVAAPPPEPQGYRGEPYRAPVPETLAGATVLDLAGTEAWRARGAVLIDVLPEVRRPENLPEGTLWRAPAHRTIPGAVWLPGTGYDVLAPRDEAAFFAALDRLTQGDRTAPLVFFCKTDCWMSWNAAKRAVARGHSQVGWFPGGVDDWQAEGRELVPADSAL